MRYTLFWKEMRELSQVLGILAGGELLLLLGFRLLPPGALPESLFAGLALLAAAALGTSLAARDRRPGTVSVLASLPIPRRRILAVRWAAGLASLLLVMLGGLAVRRLAARWGWTWEPVPMFGPGTVFLAALCALGAAAWWLRARSFSPAVPRRALSLLAVEWRQKKLLLGLLALLPLLHLAVAETLRLGRFSILGWGWLGGALLGASLFTARERDGSRCLLHVLPVARERLVGARLLNGLAAGGLFLAECLLVAWAGGRAFPVRELPFAVLMFMFFYGSAFLVGAALSPWLRSTAVAALLAIGSTFLALMILSLGEPLMDNASGAWAGTGILLALLAGLAAWSTMRSRAFEPSPGKDLRVILTVLVLWLAAAGILYLS